MITKEILRSKNPYKNKTMFKKKTNRSINMKDLLEDFTKDLNNGSDDGLNEILWYYSMNYSNLSTKFSF